MSLKFSLIAIVMLFFMCLELLVGTALAEKSDPVTMPLREYMAEFSPHQWTHYTIADGFRRIYNLVIDEDREGNLWFAGRWAQAGACRFDGLHFRPFTEGDLGRVNAILQDSTGCFWFGADGGVTRFDGKQMRKFTNEDGLAHNNVTTICEDRKGDLWFGTWRERESAGKSISRYDGKKFHNFIFNELGFPAKAREQYIYDIIEDRWGDIWFATHQGLSRYDGQVFQVYTTDNVLHHNIVQSICEDSSGHLWFGDGAGYVYEYDGKNIYVRFNIGDNVLDTLWDSSGNL